MEPVFTKRPVIDTHNHFLDGIGGIGTRLNNPRVEAACKGITEGEGFFQKWDEKRYRKDWASSKCQVLQTVFVQAFNVSAAGEDILGVEEAKWTLEMVKDTNSIISGVIANIPMKQGAQ
jgi:hypothetical protein